MRVRGLGVAGGVRDRGVEVAGGTWPAEPLSVVEVGDDHSVSDSDPHSVFWAKFSGGVSLWEVEGSGGVGASGDVGAGDGQGRLVVGSA